MITYRNILWTEEVANSIGNIQVRISEKSLKCQFKDAANGCSSPITVLCGIYLVTACQQSHCGDGAVVVQLSLSRCPSCQVALPSSPPAAARPSSPSSPPSPAPPSPRLGRTRRPPLLQSPPAASLPSSLWCAESSRPWWRAQQRSLQTPLVPRRMIPRSLSLRRSISTWERSFSCLALLRGTVYVCIRRGSYCTVNYRIVKRTCGSTLRSIAAARILGEIQHEAVVFLGRAVLRSSFLGGGGC